MERRTCAMVEVPGIHPGPLHVPSSDRHTLPSAYLQRTEETRTEFMMTADAEGHATTGSACAGAAGVGTVGVGSDSHRLGLKRTAPLLVLVNLTLGLMSGYVDGRWMSNVKMPLAAEIQTQAQARRQSNITGGRSEEGERGVDAGAPATKWCLWCATAHRTPCPVAP